MKGFINLKKQVLSAISIVMLLPGSTSSVFAQLTDVTQTPNAENAGIKKSLSEQIGAGRGDILTPGSSEFIINRDPFRSIRRGRQLFQRKFTAEQGVGPRTNDGVGDIEADGSHGAGFADSCAACHGRPKGAAGFGGDVFTRPDSRDAPHLFGLGIQEMLADEMTAELRAIRDQAIVDAQSSTANTPILNADFTDGTNSFTFVDSPFGKSRPRYSRGHLLQPPGETRRAVVVLGGSGRSTAKNISGGWETTFNIQSESDVRISGVYSLIQSANYPRGEISQARIRIDGEEIILAELTGDGKRGPEQNTGIQSFSVEVHLAAGNHTLVLGAFNSRTADRNEETHVSYDDVAITVIGTAAGTISRDLVTKGVNFGKITAFADGTVDDSKVVGVNKDLRVRPFFAEGSTISIREFIVGALNAEMGLEAPDPDLLAASSGTSVTTPSGMVLDGAVDKIEAPPVSSPIEDSDADGVTNEIDTALVDHLEFYLLNYFKPGTYRESPAARAGQRRMREFGCTTCHVPDFTIDRDRRVADVETAFDPENGIINGLYATAEARVEVIDDGSGFPPLQNPSGESFVVENIYTDFKRHDLGPGFWERNFDRTVTREFITEPLWGVGTTPPYGHDGRSINLEEVILRHGGEATASSTAFENASPVQQQELIAFLQSLVLFPPDDTASNLDGGNPQDPNFPLHGHGSINLSTQFNDPTESE